MIVEIAKLGQESKEFAGEDPAEALDLAGQDEVKPAGPLRYRLSISLIGDKLIAEGSVEAEFTFLCARCAESFTSTVSDPHFSALVEVDNKSESVDLTPDMRESIILAFPTNPRCDPGCRGLCQRCGTNLNKGSCRCGNSPADGPWNVLKNLRLG